MYIKRKQKINNPPTTHGTKDASGISLLNICTTLLEGVSTRNKKFSVVYHRTYEWIPNSPKNKHLFI